MQLGIDFGTCNSSAAFIEGDRITSIKDPATAALSTPSSVFVPPQGTVLVGRSADSRRREDPLRYRREIKRELGHNIPIKLGDQRFRVEELISWILAKIKHDADEQQAALNAKTVSGVALTIPATYQELKRDLMLQAVAQAGFQPKDVMLLEEPVAAALYYDQYYTMHDGEILLVYDLGGGTFDTALLQKQGRKFRFLDSALPMGLEMCGGVDFDRMIYRDLVENHPEIQELVRDDRDDAIAILARIVIGELCVDFKHQLSEAEEVTLPVVTLGLPRLISHRLTRAAFERMIAPTLRQTISCCQAMINNAHISREQINRILLVGGSCRIPYVRQLLQQEFGCPISMARDLELVVCYGAAIHAATLAEPELETPRPEPKTTKPSEKGERGKRRRYTFNDPFDI